jgi:hypothetical protein
MSDSVAERAPQAAPVPVASPAELFPYALFAGVLLFVMIFFVGAEEGAASVFSGMNIHEFMHDGRHLLAFPCH